MYKLDLEKAEETEIKLSTSRGMGWGRIWEGGSKGRDICTLKANSC